MEEMKQEVLKVTEGSQCCNALSQTMHEHDLEKSL